jgi:DNA-binding NarL/FixJ family response regulator
MKKLRVIVADDHPAVHLGICNALEAEELYISEKTAAYHLTHILDKLQVRSRREAARCAWKHGLLTAQDLS